MNANDIRFRCSSLGYLMPGPREKEGQLADGVVTHLVDVFVSTMYGRKEEAQGKFLDKGNEREEDSITLLSRVTKKFYKKNTERLENYYISGECDVFEGEEVRKATHTIDTKTSWSANTFFRAKQKELEKNYHWQGVGYMALTGATKHTVAYCLVNGTERAISDEKRRLAYSMGVIDTSSKNNLAYVEKCKQVEINHIFCLEEFIAECPWFDFDNDVNSWKWDIPLHDRLFTFEIERSEDEIKALYARITQCRKWMNDNLFKPELNKVLPQVDYQEKIKYGKELMKKLNQ